MHKKNNGKMFIKRQCDRQEQAAKRPRGNARPVNLQRRKLRCRSRQALVCSRLAYFRFAAARGNNRCASEHQGMEASRMFFCGLFPLRGKHSFALGLLISASLSLAAITAAPRQNPQASLGFCTRLAGYFTAITSTSARAPLGSAATA